MFFQKIAEDPEVCEEMLRIILAKPDLKVTDAQTQRFLRNIGAHSVILDLLCQDRDGSCFNVEIQKSDDDNHQKRVRFNHANIDTTFVEKGLKYKDLPDVYIIFISKFDVFQQKHTIYHIDRMIRETGRIVQNGTHEIYVNAAVDDGSDISELMQYFKHSNGRNRKFPKLSNRIRYFKESQEGVKSMSSAFEDYMNQKIQEKLQEKLKEELQVENEKTARAFLTNGASIDLVAKSLPSLTREFIENLNRQLLTPAK
ncbi:MAG: Rpn family recombination-promoting nuclease/putative transposase [Lachnospiraceae bacterium]|nr:Rpn family recombination-promoting nuclease/putative transposase [Lachnospiraceae bacterium]